MKMPVQFISDFCITLKMSMQDRLQVVGGGSHEGGHGAQVG